MPGDVRIAAAGLASVQVEALPWSSGTTVTATLASGATQALTGAAYDSTSQLWSVTVPASLTASPGQVALRWADGGSQYVDTTVDVRAGRLPDQALVASLAKGGSLTTVPARYPDWKRTRAMGDALLELERECRVALIPKRSTVTASPTHGVGRARGRFNSCGGSYVRFDAAYVRALVSCSDATVDLASAQVDTTSSLVRLATPASGHLTFTIDHGEASLAPDVARAIVLLASSRLVDGPSDDRGFIVHGEAGAMRMLTAGVGGARFSIPDVEAAYRRHRLLLVA